MLIAAQVERQADEAVAHRVGDELVDLVADLRASAAEDAAGRLGGGQRSAGLAVVERHRVEEPVEQRDVVGRHAGRVALMRAIVSVSIEWPRR